MTYDNLQTKWTEMQQENIPGGKGADKNMDELFKKYSDVSVLDILQAIVSGVQIEMEHTDDDRIALEITFDHLLEDIEYYTKLSKYVESEDFDLMKDDDLFKQLMTARISDATRSQAEQLVQTFRRIADTATNLGQDRKAFNKVEQLTDKFNL